MMTKYDVEHLFQVVVRECAAFLKIRDVEWKGARELLDEIQRVDATLHSKLRDFVSAYENWFTLTDQLIAKGGAQNDSERELILKETAKRDEKRAILLSALGR